MPATDLPLLVEAIEAAGTLARTYAGPTPALHHKPDGQGPVTEADLAVDTLLHNLLLTARPTYGWLSEETEDSAARLSHDTVFIVDPIDGTRSFVEGGETWAHSVAVAHKGQITAAAIYLPLKGKLYTAARGQGAHLNGKPITASPRREITQAKVLSAKPNYDPAHWKGPVPDFDRHYRPSLAYRLALVAEGRFDAMMTLRPSWEWDIAAGDLILTEAGARITDRTGAALRFNTPMPHLNGVIAAGPNLHPQIIAALA